MSVHKAWGEGEQDRITEMLRSFSSLPFKVIAMASVCCGKKCSNKMDVIESSFAIVTQNQ